MQNSHDRKHGRRRYLTAALLAGTLLVAGCASAGGDTGGVNGNGNGNGHDHGGNGNGNGNGDGHDHGGNGPDPISVELLTDRAEFTDDVAVQIRNTFDGLDEGVSDLPDASRIAVAEITIQPGAVIGWHTHPGPVLITIAEGDFVYRLAQDCVDRPYEAGQALIDAGGENVHTAFNPSDTDETVVVATFLGAPAEGELTEPVDGPDPAECALPTP